MSLSYNFYNDGRKRQGTIEDLNPEEMLVKLAQELAYVSGADPIRFSEALSNLFSDPRNIQDVQRHVNFYYDAELNALTWFRDMRMSDIGDMKLDEQQGGYWLTFAHPRDSDERGRFFVGANHELFILWMRWKHRA